MLGLTTRKDPPRPLSIGMIAMKDVPEVTEASNASTCDERLPYEPPQLLDRGLVSELTQSNFNTMGSEGGYS